MESKAAKGPSSSSNASADPLNGEDSPASSDPPYPPLPHRLSLPSGWVRLPSFVHGLRISTHLDRCAIWDSSARHRLSTLLHLRHHHILRRENYRECIRNALRHRFEAESARKRALRRSKHSMGIVGQLGSQMRRGVEDASKRVGRAVEKTMKIAQGIIKRTKEMAMKKDGSVEDDDEEDEDIPHPVGLSEGSTLTDRPDANASLGEADDVESLISSHPPPDPYTFKGDYSTNPHAGASESIDEGALHIDDLMQFVDPLLPSSPSTPPRLFSEREALERQYDESLIEVRLMSFIAFAIQLNYSMKEIYVIIGKFVDFQCVAADVIEQIDALLEGLGNIEKERELKREKEAEEAREELHIPHDVSHAEKFASDATAFLNNLNFRVGFPRFSRKSTVGLEEKKEVTNSEDAKDEEKKQSNEQSNGNAEAANSAVQQSAPIDVSKSAPSGPSTDTAVQDVNVSSSSAVTTEKMPTAAELIPSETPMPPQVQAAPVATATVPLEPLPSTSSTSTVPIAPSVSPSPSPPQKSNSPIACFTQDEYVHIKSLIDSAKSKSKPTIIPPPPSSPSPSVSSFLHPSPPPPSGYNSVPHRVRIHLAEFIDLSLRCLVSGSRQDLLNLRRICIYGLASYPNDLRLLKLLIQYYDSPLMANDMGNASKKIAHLLENVPLALRDAQIEMELGLAYETQWNVVPEVRMSTQTAVQAMQHYDRSFKLSENDCEGLGYPRLRHILMEIKIFQNNFRTLQTHADEANSGPPPSTSSEKPSSIQSAPSSSLSAFSRVQSSRPCIANLITELHNRLQHYAEIRPSIKQQYKYYHLNMAFALYGLSDPSQFDKAQHHLLQFLQLCHMKSFHHDKEHKLYEEVKSTVEWFRAEEMKRRDLNGRVNGVDGDEDRKGHSDDGVVIRTNVWEEAKRSTSTSPLFASCEDRRVALHQLSLHHRYVYEKMLKWICIQLVRLFTFNGIELPPVDDSGNFAMEENEKKAEQNVEAVSTVPSPQRNMKSADDGANGDTANKRGARSTKRVKGKGPAKLRKNKVAPGGPLAEAPDDWAEPSSQLSSGAPSRWASPWKALFAFCQQFGLVLTPRLVSSWYRGSVGLSLSGGGLRASFVHLGLLARLAECDMLHSIESIAAVSGGSIVAAQYYLFLKQLIQSKHDDEITHEDYINIVKKTIENFVGICDDDLYNKVLLSPLENMRVYLSKHYSRAQQMAGRYRDMFRNVYSRAEIQMGNATPTKSEESKSSDDDSSTSVFDLDLQSLKMTPYSWDTDTHGVFRPKFHNWRRSAKVPSLYLHATTLNTGHVWRFSATKMGESIDLFDREFDHRPLLTEVYYSDLKEEHCILNLPFAVAASSLVPGFFGPLPIDHLYEGLNVRLIDGGVWDNQGVQSLYPQSMDIILCSDASHILDEEDSPSSSALSVLQRSLDIAMDQVYSRGYEELKAKQKSMEIDSFIFINLKQKLRDTKLIKPYERDRQLKIAGNHKDGHKSITSFRSLRREADQSFSDYIAAFRTALDSFTEVEQCALMYTGYSLLTEQLEKKARTEGFVIGEAEKLAGDLEEDHSAGSTAGDDYEMSHFVEVFGSKNRKEEGEAKEKTMQKTREGGQMSVFMADVQRVQTHAENSTLDDDDPLPIAHWKGWTFPLSRHGRERNPMRLSVHPHFSFLSIAPIMECGNPHNAGVMSLKRQLQRGALQFSWQRVFAITPKLPYVLLGILFLLIAIGAIIWDAYNSFSTNSSVCYASIYASSGYYIVIILGAMLLFIYPGWLMFVLLGFVIIPIYAAVNIYVYNPLLARHGKMEKLLTMWEGDLLHLKKQRTGRAKMGNEQVKIDIEH